MQITFVNHTPTARIPRSAISRACARAATVTHIALPRADMSIVFVSDAAGKELNKKYRRQTYTPNVLSFDGIHDKHLGDIIICPAKAKREAASRGVGYQFWLVYLCVHGLLHLLGYDHKTTAQERKMEAVSSNILQPLYKTI